MVSSAPRSHDAEAVAERVAAECNRRPRAAFELVFAFPAGLHHACKSGLEIVDVKVDVNRRPVSLVTTNVVSSLGRFGAGGLLDESNLGVPASKNSIGRDRPGHFRQPESIAIETQALIEPWNVNRYRVLHAHTPVRGYFEMRLAGRGNVSGAALLGPRRDKRVQFSQLAFVSGARALSPDIVVHGVEGDDEMHPIRDLLQLDNRSDLI